ncbi:cytochrome c oxidase assembly protein [Methylocapsa acidiphila]|uniref:cytochrome c oxidase assembly protein n=1 Tax=Methylocapsa acidiphila TaxID=133552 RepID=UPI0004035D94|nr:cytochrome c oxidase assembly protein [Methylocapsa acidiphila]
MNESRNRDSASSLRGKRLIALSVGAASLAMLALSFAAVPIYRAFCAATGYGGTPQVAKAAPAIHGQRALTVRFDANVAPGLAWKFMAETQEIRLLTGQTATIFYKAVNLSDQAVSARAAYNVSPESAGAYFDKISCFCFDEQKLGPHEAAELPVVFFLDPALEQDPNMAGVESITLSYTFFGVKPAALLGARDGAAAPATGKRDDRSP